MRSRHFPASAELARETILRKSRARAVVLFTAAVAFVGRTEAAHAQDAGRYETVVIAPARAAASEDDAASASVVTTDRTPRSAETLPQLLSELPGLSVTRLGGLGSLATLSVRGSAANQVQVYLDGVPLNSATWGSVDLGGVAIADIERIEIYRGMSPLSFGASALGGIVALTSREPRVSGAEARVGGGSFGTRFAGGEVSWAGRRIRLLVSANRLDSAGDFTYPSDNGTAFDPTDDRNVRRENNALAQTDALVRAAVPLGDTLEMQTSLSFLDRQQGIPAFAIFRSYQASLGTERFLGSVTFKAKEALGSAGPLRVTAYGSSTEQQFRDPLAEIAYTPTHTHDRSTATGATVTGGRPVATWLRLSAVADGRFEQFSPFDELENKPTAAPGRRVFGAAGMEAHALVGRSGVEVLPSLRLEVAHDDIVDRGLFGDRADARPADYVLPVARLALIDRPASWLSLHANVGRFARLPTMFERYGNTGTVVGNPQLRPESGLNADLGATATRGLADATGWSVDAAVFGSRVGDLIEMQQGRDTQRARNIGEALIVGGELATTARYTRYTRLVAQTTFTDARDVSGVDARHGHQLPHRPRVRAYGRPEVRRVPLAFGWEVGAYGDVDVTGGNYLDPANLVAVPARVLFGAGASVESPRTGWRLVASAQNLGDAHVVDLAGFPLPGRSVFFTLQWSSSANRPNKENVP